MQLCRFCCVDFHWRPFSHADTQTVPVKVSGPSFVRGPSSGSGHRDDEAALRPGSSGRCVPCPAAYCTRTDPRRRRTPCTASVRDRSAAWWSLKTQLGTTVMTQKLSTHNKREKWGGTSGYSLENKSRVPGLSGGETTPSGGRVCLFFFKGTIHSLSTHHYADGGVGEVFESTKHFWSKQQPNPIQLKNWRPLKKTIECFHLFILINKWRQSLAMQFLCHRFPSSHAPK